MTKIKSIKNYLLLILKGIGVGIAMLIPGVSGGTLALMLNIYDDIIESVAGFRKHIKDSIFFLIPIALGGLIGYALALVTFKYGLEYIPIPTLSLFVGLIIGGIPSIGKHVRKEKPKASHIISFVVAALVVIAIALLSISLDIELVLESLSVWDYVLIFAGGMISAFALVVPGISGSAVLLILGLHGLVVQTAIPKLILFDSNFGSYLLIDAIFGVGAIIGLLLISKLMRYLLKEKETITFYAILGFIIASIFAIYYNNDVLSKGYYDILVNNPYQYFLSAALIAVGIFISLFLERLSKKSKKVEKVEEK